jgi:pimeloyl-ACP methyl ester carboxylesterase
LRRKYFILLACLLVLGLALLKPLALYIYFLPYLFAGPPPSYACDDGPGFRYCIYHPPFGTLEDTDSVMYFLHLGSGDEKTWRTIPISRVFYGEFRRRGLKAPTVMSVSFGPYWTLFDEGGGRLVSPVMSDFLNRAMPWLESKTGTPKRRYLWGMSQGGLNAALVIFKEPKLWSGAVLECPALYGLDVFAPASTKESYAAAHGLDVNRLQYGLDLVSNRISGQAQWKKQDPLIRAAHPPAYLPPIFIDCNRSDNMGFNDGARLFADTLRTHGKKVIFQEESGPHCAVDPLPPSRFIADLQENPHN